MKAIVYSLAFLTVALSVGVVFAQPDNSAESEMITKGVYLKNKDVNGIVLLDVNWGRQWKCGGNENAQLMSLAFDKLPMTNLSDESAPFLVLRSPSRILVDPVFLNYGYSLPPGEYALSGFKIKVAATRSNVGFLSADRETLYKNGIPSGGTFTVKSNEAVFIGNFYLDCAYGPTLWRYYSNGKAAFDAQVQEYKKRFPFLQLDDVSFRLFKTKEFGSDYELAP